MRAARGVEEGFGVETGEVFEDVLHLEAALDQFKSCCDAKQTDSAKQGEAGSEGDFLTLVGEVLKA